MSQTFLSKPNTKDFPKKLFVIQGELALLQLIDCPFEAVCSDDATSCVVVVLRSKTHLLIAHLDDNIQDDFSYRDCFASNICQLGNGDVDCFMVGDFNDDKVAENVLELLQFLQRVSHQQIRFHHRLHVCGSKENKCPKTGFPRTRGLLYHIPSDEPFPFDLLASQHDRGPMIARRHARRAMSQGSLTVVMTPGPQHELLFDGMLIPNSLKERYDSLIQLAKSKPESYLQQYSTTPLHESPNFIQDMIGYMEFIVNKIEESTTGTISGVTMVPTLKLPVNV